MSRLDEIRDRLVSATPGPWRAINADDALLNIQTGYGAEVVGEVAWLGKESDEQAIRDAEFIAHCPEDVAYLLAEVDRLRTGWENSAAGHDTTALIARSAVDEIGRLQARQGKLDALLNLADMASKAYAQKHGPIILEMEALGVALDTYLLSLLGEPA